MIPLDALAERENAETKEARRKATFNKELVIDLDYLARSYGLEEPEYGFEFELGASGVAGNWLIMRGRRKGAK